MVEIHKKLLWNLQRMVGEMDKKKTTQQFINEAKSRFGGYRYQPQRSSKGYTECYQIEIKSDFSQII